ncbi:hypothetical protein V2A60_007613 [Cordyceps javanica]|uniref:Kelch motif domain-containing protein n=1 Tax=Cordyceps javanica TaxID=43265 RepID=A0A545W7I0_9HYPO|nr:Kelch motif domain-containing protein [Cordyceps javanica]TQW09888.1 Kelch motif domain-containing protein [Cordyceps javanica]
MADSGKSARPRAVSSSKSSPSIIARRSHKSLVSSPHGRTKIYEDSDDSDGSDEDDNDDDENDDDDDDRRPSHPALPRSHTPGHLASKSVNDRSAGAAAKQAAELAVRQRSQSASQVPPRPATAGANSSSSKSYPKQPPPPPPPMTSDTQGDHEKEAKRGYSRSTSVLTSKSNTVSSRSTSAALSQVPKGEHVAFPPLQDPKDAPDIAPAPASGMYWSRAPMSGAAHSNLRAHTTTLIGSNIYIFGGCDARTCFNTMYVLDADAFYWSVPYVVGEIPMPLRAMTCTAVGKKLVVFGGGDGPAYYNDVYVLDTVNFRWTKPKIIGDRVPSKRRAHTACLYKNGIYVFGGGDGVRALNDIWRLEVGDMTKMSWRLISGPEKEQPAGAAAATAAKDKPRRPKARGYHTANMVGSKLIIYGGSDGGECFDDVWVYDVDTHVWKAVPIAVTFRRLSHTATIVGSYLFVIGGHDGSEYCNDVLLLNLVTMAWDKRRVYGQCPTGRGYHGTVLHDSRLMVVGGFDGSDVFGDVHILELAVHAYYSQISHFSIEV